MGGISPFAKVVPAEQIEQAAGQQYAQMLQQASQQRALGPADNAQVQRLRYIAERLIPQTYEWNPRAREWRWQVNLIGSQQLNAFCMPGGKIAFYYGILDKLRLNDDEVAMIMGHEMAHALREHARERMGKTMATRGALEIGSALFGLGNGGRYLADMGGQLLTLRFGREDESEADLVGMEIAARARLRPGRRRDAVEQDGRGQQGRAAAVAVDAPGRADAHPRHPGQPAEGRAALCPRAAARAALRAAGATPGRRQRLTPAPRPAGAEPTSASAACRPASSPRAPPAGSRPAAGRARGG